MFAIDLLKLYGIKRTGTGRCIFTKDEVGWITVHPNGKGTKGQPVKIEKRTGEILGGLGGKFNGEHISALPEHGRHEEHGAQALIKWYNSTQKGGKAKGKAKTKAATAPKKSIATKEKLTAKAGSRFDQASKTWFGKKYRTIADLSPSEALANELMARPYKIHGKKLDLLFSKDSDGNRITFLVSDSQIKGKKTVYGLTGNGGMLCVVPKDMCNEDIARLGVENQIKSLLSRTASLDSVAIGAENEYSPKKIGRFPLGKPMDAIEANMGRCNPHYVRDKQYHINCQACVVAYEARRRGYDVQAKNRIDKKSNSNFLSMDTQTLLATRPEIAWVDPKTGTPPDTTEVFNLDGRFSDSDKSRKMISEKLSCVKKGERWNLIIESKTDGHIVSLQHEVKSGELEIYDPQNGYHFVGMKKIAWYFDKSGASTARIYRVDDKNFNLDIVSNIFEKG